jgi:hypothetical protein
MPTWLYRLVHSDSNLTKEEKEKILAWVSESEKRFSKNEDHQLQAVEPSVVATQAVELQTQVV